VRARRVLPLSVMKDPFVALNVMKDPFIARVAGVTSAVVRAAVVMAAFLGSTRLEIGPEFPGAGYVIADYQPPTRMRPRGPPRSLRRGTGSSGATSVALSGRKTRPEIPVLSKIGTSDARAPGFGLARSPSHRGRS